MLCKYQIQLQPLPKVLNPIEKHHHFQYYKKKPFITFLCRPILSKANIKETGIRKTPKEKENTQSCLCNHSAKPQQQTKQNSAGGQGST